MASSMSVNLGLPAVPEVDSPELYTALLPLYNAVKNATYALDAYTGNTPVAPADYDTLNTFTSLLVQRTAVIYVKLTEAVTKGATINLWNSGGLRARKAIVSSQPAQAFALASGGIGDTIPICMFGLCTLISGMTPGTVYYQSSTAGTITASVTAQKLGVALGTSQLWFSPA